MKNLCLISILEAIYIIYMFNYFKTKIPLDTGFILHKLGIKNKFFEHNTIELNEPVNMVCPFGHFISWYIGLFLILRNYIPCLKKLNDLFIILLFIGSLMNFNVLIYLIPIFIIELYYRFSTGGI